MPTPAPTTVIGKLKAYDPGHDLPALRLRSAEGELVELGSNENSYGPGPSVLAALRAAPVEEVYRYPDPLAGRLRARLAARLDWDAQGIVVGNGSHELLMLLAQCFAAPGDEVVFSEFGFAVFPIAAAAVGATPRPAPALPVSDAMPRGHDLPALAARVSARTRLVYLANPNNPTGTWFAREELARFLDVVPESALVVVDEAYHEYVTEPGVGTAMQLLPRHRNLVVTRTFSKGYGLAGLRVGYAVADPEVIGVVNRLRESFNANALALLAAETALGDNEHLQWVCEQTRRERERVSAALAAAGHFVHPSQTNFVLVDFREPAPPIEAHLLATGVVVRPMGGYGLPTCLRVSVGTPVENDRFLAALASYPAGFRPVSRA